VDTEGDIERKTDRQKDITSSCGLTGWHRNPTRARNKQESRKQIDTGYLETPKQTDR